MVSAATSPRTGNLAENPPPQGARLSIKELRKVYPTGVVALDGLTLSVGEGVFGLLGPNGAGKTTLMEILATLLAPTSGRVEFEGIDIVRRPHEARRLLGYLPQSFDLFPNLRVVQFLVMMGRLYGLGGKRLRSRIGEAAEAAGIGHILRRPIKGLSGGERQRVGIAQALLSDPPLLIVDEPTSGLDPQERLQFRNLLFDLGRGRVVILSTHLVKDVEFSCTDMLVLHRGKALYRGTPAQLVASALGKAWEFEVAPSDFERVRREFLLVTIVEGDDGVFRARVVSDRRPKEEARQVEPNLEDAYVLLVGSEARAQE